MASILNRVFRVFSVCDVWERSSVADPAQDLEGCGGINNRFSKVVNLRESVLRHTPSCRLPCQLPYR